MRKLLLITTLLAFVFASSAWAADISGTWNLKYSGQQEERSLDMVIKADGENLTVTTEHPSLGDMSGTGTIKGDEISFNLKATGEMQIEFLFTGKVTGDKMSGTREVKMAEGAGGRGGAPGGEGAAPGGRDAASGREGGQPPAGGGQAPAGGPPSGGQAPAGGPPSGGQAPAGGQQGGGQAMSNEWTAVRK